MCVMALPVIGEYPADSQVVVNSCVSNYTENFTLLGGVCVISAVFVKLFPSSNLVDVSPHLSCFMTHSKSIS